MQTEKMYVDIKPETIHEQDEEENARALTRVKTQLLSVWTSNQLLVIAFAHAIVWLKLFSFFLRNLRAAWTVDDIAEESKKAFIINPICHI